MKPALLDVNVLLALAWPAHQHHRAAHRWFHRESRHGWATCALLQLGFVRLSSNPADTADAVSPTSAATLLAQLTSHARHLFWRNLPPVDAAALRHTAGHQQVMDAGRTRSNATLRRVTILIAVPTSRRRRSSRTRAHPSS